MWLYNPLGIRMYSLDAVLVVTCGCLLEARARLGPAREGRDVARDRARGKAE